MKKPANPPPPETGDHANNAMVEINEALVIGSVRQHELTRSAVALNTRLELEITERKRVEDSLRVSEVRYRRLFETASDGVLLLDPLNGKIIDANPSITRLSGHTHDLLVGRQLWEIGLFASRTANRRMLTKLKKEPEIHFGELPMEHREGHRLTVEVAANLYRQNGHNVIQCHIRDITERKRAEDILRRNEVLFTALIELAPVGVFVVDAGFRLQQVNPNAMHVFKGINPLIGRDFGEILHILWPNPAADEVTVLFRHTLETGEAYQSPEFSERRKDTGIDEVYDYQTQSVTLPDGKNGLVCFFNNITERKNDEAARRSLAVLTASNVKLKEEIVRREAVEVSLHQTQQEQVQLLGQSRLQEEMLRDLAHRILCSQEEERKRISRELHDVVSQNLIGINLSIAALSKGDAAASPHDFRRKITETQRFLEESVERMHHFASELRPLMLDDLGLIPAIRSHLERFMEETGIRPTFSAFPGIEKADGAILTVLFRVAQEALANVAKHANASEVAVNLTTSGACFQMEIQDDGDGFEGAGGVFAGKTGRLGLLGMRERVEMVGGCFQIESLLGKGTTVRAVFTIPLP